MVKSNIVPLFLVLILSLNCQLYLTIIQVLLLLSTVGYTWTFHHSNSPCFPFPAVMKRCSFSWSISHVPPASQAHARHSGSRGGWLSCRRKPKAHHCQQELQPSTELCQHEIPFLEQHQVLCENFIFSANSITLLNPLIFFPLQRTKLEIKASDQPQQKYSKRPWKGAVIFNAQIYFILMQLKKNSLAAINKSFSSSNSAVYELKGHMMSDF